MLVMGKDVGHLHGRPSAAAAAVEDGRDLVRRVDLRRLAATATLDPAHRSELGQYLTPGAVGDLMANMFGDLGDLDVRLLEAGAGVGSLIAAFCALAVARPARPRSISVVAYEVDDHLAAYLAQTLDGCDRLCTSHGIAFDATIERTDFVASAVETLDRGLFAPGPRAFNRALLNPPYGKIGTGSRERTLLTRVGIETTNLYAAFVALATRLLDPGGELVAITPRSFCNGPYFRSFRQDFLGQMALRRLHLFEARDQSFAEDGVLQENLIVRAVKGGPPHAIEITTSEGPDDDLIGIRTVEHASVVIPGDDGSFIRLVTDELGDVLTTAAARWDGTVEDLGLQVSTGRVVDFRSTIFLREQPEAGTVPLIYPGHIQGGQVRWPRPGFKKPNAIVACPVTAAMLFPRGHYVVVKRLSAKEEKRRIVAAVYDPSVFDGELVAFENHVNVYHANGRGLDPDLARGLATFLGSSLVDALFRQFNGHTQVNATDLRSLRYPNAEILRELARRADAVDDPEQRDQLVAELTVGPAAAKALGTMKRIDDTVALLKALGMPRAQQNERSALTLLALLDLGPATPWSRAKRPQLGVSQMMELFRERFGKDYAPNTRETVRRQTVHQLVAAGIAGQDPDDLERPIDSGKTVYQVTAAVHELARLHGKPGWESRLAAYLMAHPGRVWPSTSRTSRGRRRSGSPTIRTT